MLPASGQHPGQLPGIRHMGVVSGPSYFKMKVGETNRGARRSLSMAQKPSEHTGASFSVSAPTFLVQTLRDSRKWPPAVCSLPSAGLGPGGAEPLPEDRPAHCCMHPPCGAEAALRVCTFLLFLLHLLLLGSSGCQLISPWATSGHNQE